jgi:hypothetical protein
MDSTVKNLDELNQTIASPRTLSSTLALLPFLMGILCIPLALGAAPSLPFEHNYLAIFCAGQSVLALFFILIPRLFRWDWRTQYFGMPMFYIGSVSIIGLVPWLAIIIFGNLPFWARLLTFFAYFGSIVWWCRRFVTYYRAVFSDKRQSAAIYKEDVDAIYYHQQTDKDLIEKGAQLAQIPSNLSFLLFIALAFASTPFVGGISRLIGIPAIHIFLTISSLPIVLMCLGMAVRGYLIFYYYPRHLKRETGKNVYVVM